MLGGVTVHLFTANLTFLLPVCTFSTFFTEKLINLFCVSRAKQIIWIPLISRIGNLNVNRVCFHFNKAIECWLANEFNINFWLIHIGKWHRRCDDEWSQGEIMENYTCSSPGFNKFAVHWFGKYIFHSLSIDDNRLNIAKGETEPQSPTIKTMRYL